MTRRGGQTRGRSLRWEREGKIDVKRHVSAISPPALSRSRVGSLRPSGALRRSQERICSDGVCNLRRSRSDHNAFLATVCVAMATPRIKLYFYGKKKKTQENSPHVDCINLLSLPKVLFFFFGFSSGPSRYAELAGETRINGCVCAQVEGCFHS